MQLRYFIIFFILFLTACSSQSPLPVDHYYRFPEMTETTHGQQLAQLVSIIPFQANGLLNERAIVYSDDGIELRQYHYHHWEDSPSRLLTERLAEKLRLSHFADVVLTTYEGDSDLVIKGRIKSFERLRYKNNESVNVKIVIQVNSNTGNLPILFKEYTESIAVSSSSINDAVIAFGKAVDLIYNQFYNDLVDITKS